MKPMKKLSPDFKIEEFVRKEDADICSRSCPDYISRIKNKLVDPVFGPLRKKLASKIIITSGFRTALHNSSIGGKPHSHHLFHADRCAADFTAQNIASAWEWLEEHQNRFCYAYWDKERNFIHISALTATDDRVGKMWVIDGKGENKNG